MGALQDSRIYLFVETPALLQDVQAFLLDAKARNLAPRTLTFYQEKLGPFLTFLQTFGVTQAPDITPEHVRHWLVYLQEKGHSAGGVHAFFRAVRAFLTWLYREGEIPKNPVDRVRAPRLPQELLAPVAVDSVKAMLQVCDPQSLTGARDRAILLCLLDSGCRAREFLALNIEDVDWETGAVLVRHGKGNKARVVFLGAKARREALRFLKRRGRGLHEGAPLWVTDEGKRLSYNGLREMLRRRARKAGVEPPSPHDFRRAFALLTLRGGADVFSLQRLMGHSNVSVLRRYLDQDPTDLQMAHEKAGPVDRLLH
jgi:integrase/recombinase XerD